MFLSVNKRFAMLLLFLCFNAASGMRDGCEKEYDRGTPTHTDRSVRNTAERWFIDHGWSESSPMEWPADFDEAVAGVRLEMGAFIQLLRAFFANERDKEGRSIISASEAAGSLNTLLGELERNNIPLDQFKIEDLRGNHEHTLLFNLLRAAIEYEKSLKTSSNYRNKSLAFGSFGFLALGLYDPEIFLYALTVYLFFAAILMFDWQGLRISYRSDFSILRNLISEVLNKQDLDDETWIEIINLCNQDPRPLIIKELFEQYCA